MHKAPDGNLPAGFSHSLSRLSAAHALLTSQRAGWATSPTAEARREANLNKHPLGAVLELANPEPKATQARDLSKYVIQGRPVQTKASRSRNS